MKKLLVVLVLLLAAVTLFAEDLMLGNGYVVDEYGEAYSFWDLDEDIPMIDIVELYEDDMTAVLYYSYGYESFIEYVDMEMGDEYSSVPQFIFYSEYLGPVTMHISDDAEVSADDLYAMLASYTVDTEIGFLTYIAIVAAEYYQYEDEQIDNFWSYVNDIKSEYEYEVYGGK